MKAVVVNAVNAGFDVEEVQIAAPIGGEVLIEVKASGLCHSDLTIATNDLGFPMPAVFGHELAGVVTAVGPTVTGIAVGDHVVGSLIQSCGKCRRCMAGRSYNCLHPEATLRTAEEEPRLSRDGQPVAQGFGLAGFAQQALVHENQLVVLPKEVPWAQAALLGCGVVTGAGAVLNTANVQAGDSVVIIGAGGVGLNAVNGALVAGASRIIVIDLNDTKLETAKKFGATDVINSSTIDPVEAVLALTGGADHVFDFVGFQSVTEQGLKMLGIGGGLYLIGLGKGGTQFTVDSFDALNGQKRVQGVYMGSSTLQRDIPLYAELYLQGRFNLDDLVSKEISLDEVNEGYAALKDPAINRVVITSF